MRRGAWLLWVVLLCACSEPAMILQSPQLRGGPLRVSDGSGDRLYLLTSQWATRKLSGYRSRTRQIRLYVDLWALDPATAQPVYRRRLS